MNMWKIKSIKTKRYTMNTVSKMGRDVKLSTSIKRG